MPIDFGASRRGVNLGPTALRLAGLEEKLHALGHTITNDSVPPLTLSQEYVHEYDPKLKYLPAIVEACKHLSERTFTSLEEGFHPLILGGDHSLAVGSVAGVSKYWKVRGKKLGLIWIDAHGDYNTPQTTPSGNVHGMPLAALNGLGHHYLTSLSGDYIKVPPESTLVFGVRDLDTGEKSNLKNAGVRTITMAQIDRDGISDSVQEALGYLRNNCDIIHVSFDVDSIDPVTAPGVGTPVPGGLSYREAHFLMESLAETGIVTSVDVVEVNPLLDIRNSTAHLAVEMLSSLFGETIL